MASHLLKPSSPLPHQTYLLSLQKPVPRRLTVLSLSSSSSTSTMTPPSSREEAISQAKLSLSTTLKKPLNNPMPLPSRRLKKLSQPRYRVEIPLVDDSPDSLVRLAFEVFSGLPVTRKGSTPTVLIIWPNATVLQLAQRAFYSVASVTNSDLGSVTAGALSSADLAVFLAPEASMLEEFRRVTTTLLYPKPVVLFNPKWGFEEEKGFGDGLGSFVGSFDVVYSFMGLEVRGLIRRRKGVVFKCARDGVAAGGEGWLVMVEEEEEEGRTKGELKVVSRFKRRPTIGEVESVLYNLMAASSPVTKSVKFIRDLASSVVGNKGKQ
ncbi:Uncharacterized protein M6B38_217995 [Iris pallida]|uniref:DUF1995 domain-containing protein n=1 Tax=Iris pallida TaxID=29817 RepID=A0AAX6E0U5_IRIPA|nr:Uncharacterized protein M6B38_217995 [Iris pallida]